MKLQPAWQFIFEVAASDRHGSVTGYRWKDECHNGRFALKPAESADPLLVGEMRVTSWQPYEPDALEDALRAAKDLCAILTVGGNILMTPQVPVKGKERLVGAKDSQATVGISDSVSIAVTHTLAAEQAKLDVAEALEEKPVLRANLDTLALSKTTNHDATRFITLYRIYENIAADVLEKESRLLDATQIEEMIQAVLSTAAAGTLSSEDRDRTQATVSGALKRLRIRSRPVVLSEHFSNLLKRPIAQELIKQADKLRGTFAHNASADDTSVSDELERFIYDAVWTEMRAQLGYPPAY